ncbi:MAG: prepilin peptidase [Lachnospiraceae bacterium]|nr:prepilin peptidase [Lachnospiraceae bacterium]
MGHVRPGIQLFKICKGDGRLVVLCASLCIACLFDYTKRKIPNLFQVFILALGMMRSVHIGGWERLVLYLLSTVGVLVVLYPLFRIGGLGAGDVKLLSVCSGYFSVSQVFMFLFYSMLISALFSLVLLLKERNIRERAVYFVEYCTEVARSGRWQLYLPEVCGKRFKGVCMSGPILCSVLLGLGGLY